MQRFSQFILLICLFISCDTQKRAIITAEPQMIEKKAEETKVAKNVIFLIGDGMGVTQISAGLYSNSNVLNL